MMRIDRIMSRISNLSSTHHARIINASSRQYHHERIINASSRQHHQSSKYQQRIIRAPSTHQRRIMNASSTQHQPIINASSAHHQSIINPSPTHHERIINARINASSTRHHVVPSCVHFGFDPPQPQRLI
jgi:hypothetical protein